MRGQIPAELEAQAQRAAEALTVLEQTLADLEHVAGDARKVARRGGTPDLAGVHGAASAVSRAEEAHDLALLDLKTASGEDA